MFQHARTVQAECNQVRLRSTSGRLLPKGRNAARSRSFQRAKLQNKIYFLWTKRFYPPPILTQFNFIY